MTEVFDCMDDVSRADGIAAAVAALHRGQVVVLPTDTVYGIGCDAFDPGAVESVLTAKGRGRDMPPPVLIPTSRTALGLATSVPDYATTLMERFWPGPLTIVLRAHPSLHWDLGDTNGTVALRVPDHPVALELLGQVGPMAVTSANTTGVPPARTAAQARDMLGESVAVYLDAGPVGQADPSTIVDCTGAHPLTLRLGALGQSEIDAVLVAPAEPVVARTQPGRAEPEDDPARRAESDSAGNASAGNASA
ncbi:MAG: threonylcarbamoyl-AMP synthase [Intrasporangium sp.]|uniref:L-threonylcarbamoyladenylate synthase n=1 Tax=Intrasporangium sp. TaxID=1925024 RepID=UPI002649EEC7|nr:L-threonylcarbamoyladenylate synthase [Intrasporangium sp.]MDN5796162.1 threonylcarbamoyl-AMP synthase [Intrasporangium sp.]